MQCLEVSDNDDLITATVDWLYMTYRRQGKVEEAKALLEKIYPTMTINENDSYFKRLHMYKGLLPVDSVLNVNSNNTDVIWLSLHKGMVLAIGTYIIRIL